MEEVRGSSPLLPTTHNLNRTAVGGSIFFVLTPRRVLAHGTAQAQKKVATKARMRLWVVRPPAAARGQSGASATWLVPPLAGGANKGQSLARLASQTLSRNRMSVVLAPRRVLAHGMAKAQKKSSDEGANEVVGGEAACGSKGTVWREATRLVPYCRSRRCGFFIYTAI